MYIVVSDMQVLCRSQLLKKLNFLPFDHFKIYVKYFSYHYTPKYRDDLTIKNLTFIEVEFFIDFPLYYI